MFFLFRDTEMSVLVSIALVNTVFSTKSNTSDIEISLNNSDITSLPPF